MYANIWVNKYLNRYQDSVISLIREMVRGRINETPAQYLARVKRETNVTKIKNKNGDVWNSLRLVNTSYIIS